MSKQRRKNKNSTHQLVPAYIGIVVTIILILALGIGNLMILTYSSTKIAEHFGPLETALQNEDWQEADKIFDETNTHWDNQKAWWQMTIDHKDVDKIDNSFTSLYAAIVIGDSKAAIRELYVLRYNLQHIPEVEAISVTNIL